MIAISVLKFNFIVSYISSTNRWSIFSTFIGGIFYYKSYFKYIEAELHVRGRLTSGTSLQIVQFLCASPEGAATAWPERRLTLHLPRVQVERVRGTPGWAVYDAMTLMMFREMGEPGELGELFINVSGVLGNEMAILLQYNITDYLVKRGRDERNS